MTPEVTHTALHAYIEYDVAFYTIYEDYQPDTELTAQIRAAQPSAHVITPSRTSCADCVRNLPRMARIAEHLPGWTWEVFDSDMNEARKAALGIRRIPTFIVYEAEDGQELGRIVENPASGTLERDLLQIVTSR